jgi:RNA polymerase sigma-70 factor (ECF subfamily)
MPARTDAPHHSLRAGPDGLVALDARFRRPLRRYFASYRLNPHDADDLTQEVFMRLAGQSAPVELRRPEHYVFTLARNLVRDRARRLHHRAAQRSLPLEEVELRCGGATPDQALEAQEKLGRATDVLASLKPATRQAFLLHRVHGYSHAEIAAATGVSVSMVEKHVMAAVAALRAVDE